MPTIQEAEAAIGAYINELMETPEVNQLITGSNYAGYGLDVVEDVTVNGTNFTGTVHISHEGLRNEDAAPFGGHITTSVSGSLAPKDAAWGVAECVVLGASYDE